MALIGYARAAKDEGGLDAQKQRLQEAGCDKVYSESSNGVGRQATRTAFGHCVRALKEGDTLVFDTFERVGRSALNMIELCAGLHERGIHFLSLKEGIDTRTADGKLFFKTIAAMLACEGLSEQKIHASITSAEAPGENALRSKIKARQLREISRYVDAGWTTKKIADAMKVNETTIRRAYKALGRNVDNRYAERMKPVHQ